MASKWYMAGLNHIAATGNWDELDVRCVLCMANTTCDTEDDGIATIDDFTTIDECDDTGYSEQALGNEAVNQDDANNRVEFDGDDVTYSNNGDASRACPGILLKHYVDGTNDIPLVWSEFGSPVTLDGNDVDVQWNAEGIAQATQA